MDMRESNPHDASLELCWRACRYCAAEIVRPDRRERVLGWIARMEPRFPGSPWLAAWRRIVEGLEPDLLRELRSTADYFALPADRRGLWRPLIQSQPFSCLVPGRTTHERRAVLSRLP